MDKNNLIQKHYLTNYNRLIKRMINRVPDKSVALAEEVVQEAYSRALKYFSTFDDNKSLFDTWFNRILKNALNDCRQIEKEKGVTFQLDENIEELSLTKEEKSQYNRIIYYIYNTSNRDKEILTLFFIHGYTSRDISVYLGIRDNNIRQIILKHRIKIKEEIGIH